jgi:hypothetical protein
MVRLAGRARSARWCAVSGEAREGPLKGDSQVGGAVAVWSRDRNGPSLPEPVAAHQPSVIATTPDWT